MTRLGNTLVGLAIESELEEYISRNNIHDAEGSYLISRHSMIPSERRERVITSYVSFTQS